MPFRVLHLTDLHLFADPAARLYGVPTTETLSAVLSHMEANEGPIDQLIVTGDHAHDERLETYREIREMLSPWWDRVRFVPGNHDDRSSMREAFGDRVEALGARLVFSVDVGDWRLIGLDSQVVGEVAGALDDAQIEWLAECLDDHGTEPVGVFLHHPPGSVENPWMDAMGLQNPGALLGLVRASPQVRFVACGHVHRDFASSFGHAGFFTTLSTALQFDPRTETPRFTTEAPGYRVFALDGECFRTRTVRIPQLGFEPQQLP